MLFLTDVDHVSFEKANGTRQNNLQSATVSLQVVIGLCKRKETAALISQNRRIVSDTGKRTKSSARQRFFSFPRCGGRCFLLIYHKHKLQMLHKCSRYL